VPRSNSDIESFVQAWISENMRRMPRGPSATPEIDRLAAEITRAARMQGISGRELNCAVGDIDEYLSEQYQRNFASP